MTLAKDEPPLRVSRCLGKVHGSQPGPALIIIAAMHGNETAGVRAARNFLHDAESMAGLLKGDVYAFVGNLAALAQEKRYLQTDLNRLWSEERMEAIKAAGPEAANHGPEFNEQVQLWHQIERVMKEARGKIALIDLHTTSVESVPFLIMADTLMNREFASHFPLPAVIGVEEYLPGPLLTYANDLGMPSFAFEAGQHNNPETVNFQEFVMWMALNAWGITSIENIPEYHMMNRTLHNEGRANTGLYEICYRYAIEPGEAFKMKDGFKNFQQIARGDILASNRSGDIRAARGGRIFMPLYQEQGEDGFFVIHRLGARKKLLTEKARKAGLSRFLNWLPGVRSYGNHRGYIVLSNSLTNLYAPPLLKAMGYRQIKTIGKKRVFLRRRHDWPVDQSHRDNHPV